MLEVEALAESGQWVRGNDVLCCAVWLVMRDGGMMKCVS